MPKWEFRSMLANVATLSTNEVLAQMNELGAQGWKLAAAVPEERHGYSHDVHLLFMRQTNLEAAVAP